MLLKTLIAGLIAKPERPMELVVGVDDGQGLAARVGTACQDGDTLAGYTITRAPAIAYDANGAEITRLSTVTIDVPAVDGAPGFTFRLGNPLAVAERHAKAFLQRARCGRETVLPGATASHDGGPPPKVAYLRVWFTPAAS